MLIPARNPRGRQQSGGPASIAVRFSKAARTAPTEIQSLGSLRPALGSEREAGALILSSAVSQRLHEAPLLWGFTGGTHRVCITDAAYLPVAGAAGGAWLSIIHHAVWSARLLDHVFARTPVGQERAREHHYYWESTACTVFQAAPLMAQMSGHLPGRPLPVVPQSPASASSLAA